MDGKSVDAVKEPTVPREDERIEQDMLDHVYRSLQISRSARSIPP
jgi:hypothetical protein